MSPHQTSKDITTLLRLRKKKGTQRKSQIKANSYSNDNAERYLSQPTVVEQDIVTAAAAVVGCEKESGNRSRLSSSPVERAIRIRMVCECVCMVIPAAARFDQRNISCIENHRLNPTPVLCFGRSIRRLQNKRSSRGTNTMNTRLHSSAMNATKMATMTSM